MWSLDRRVAASAVVVAALALAIPMAVSDAPALDAAARADRAGRASSPSSRTAARDDLDRDLRVHAHQRGRAASCTTRSSSPTCRATGDRPTLDIDDGLGSLVVTSGAAPTRARRGRAARSASRRPTVGRTARPGAVYGGAVVSGRYDIAAAPSQRSPGSRRGASSSTPPRATRSPASGSRREQCYSNDGIPLPSRVQGSLRDRRAPRDQLVRTTVGRSDLLPLLEQYGLERLAPAR